MKTKNTTLYYLSTLMVIATILFTDCSKGDDVEPTPIPPLEITWSDSAEIFLGTPLDSTQLNAKSNVAGSFVYTPTIGTILSEGNKQILKVEFLPRDTRNYERKTKTVLINVTSTIKLTSAGSLAIVAKKYLKTATSLKIEGVIDARDFKTMRDSMPSLWDIDLSAATVVAYAGSEGTSPDRTVYPENGVPDNTFCESLDSYFGGNIHTFIFPSSVKTIGEKAFASCSYLTGTLTIPSSVTNIGNFAFYRCSRLTGLTIPSSVTNIGNHAFFGCIGLTGSLTIPSSVTNIGRGAFYGCYYFTSIHAFANTPIQVELNCFNSFDRANSVLHVPIGSKDLYAVADGWKYFTNIVDDIVVN